MARFYGEVNGQSATPATRTGSKNSGMTAHIRGWSIGCYVRLYVNEDGEDEIVISATGGSNNPGATEIVFTNEKGEQFTVRVEEQVRLRVHRETIKLNLNS